MERQFSRFSYLIGEEGLEILSSSRVFLFGLGGVGGAALEVLSRAGVGEFDLIDADTVNLTNCNRQFLATMDNIGERKVDEAERRILSINPKAIIHKHPYFHLPSNHEDIFLEEADFVIDAIDTVAAKMDIISACYRLNIPLACALGCGNRLDPGKVEATDIYKTHDDPLAKIIRKKCRDMGIPSLRVVYSAEPPTKPIRKIDEASSSPVRRDIPASSPFVPPTAGIYLGYEAVKTLLEKKKPAKSE